LAKTKIDPKILTWVSENRGAIRRVSETVKVEVSPSESYVSMVLHGKRTGDSELRDAVVAALKKAGAPIK